jgi:hypothetical protein
MAVPIAIPCRVLVCSYAAPNAKSKAEHEVFNLGFARREKWLFIANCPNPLTNFNLSSIGSEKILNFVFPVPLDFACSNHLRQPVLN